MAEPILTEKQADVTTITLNRPEAGNRQTDATWAEVTKTIDAAAQDSRVILFKGAGDDFCLGREAMGQPGPVLEAYGVRERSDTIFNLYGGVSQRESSHHRCGSGPRRRPGLCPGGALRHHHRKR